MWFLGLKILNLFFFVSSLDAKKAQHSLVFDDFQRGKLLLGKPLMVRHKVFSSSCAILRAMNFECISFNYCSRLKCILNTKDIFSRDVILDDDPHCDYHGMDRPTTPSCVERGEEKLIITDTDGYPNFAGLIRKDKTPSGMSGRTMWK